MINRLRLLLCALCLVGWGSCVSPSPAPTPPSPSPPPVPTVVEPGPCADPVACACAVLAAYDCPESKPTPKGQDCHAVYAPVVSGNLPGHEVPECVAKARTLAQVRGCGVTCSLPGAPASGPLGVVQPSGPGQTTMAHSLSVAVASDQTPLPISGTITATVSTVGQGAANDGGSPWYVQSGTLATAAAQTTANASLSSIDGKLPAAATATTAITTPTASKIYSLIAGYNGTTWDALVVGNSTVGALPTGLLDTLNWAVYHSSPSTRTNGQGGPVETDATGNARSAEQFAAVAEDNTVGVLKVENRYSYAHITTATTTVVKSGAGFLHAININTPVASATITVDDATSATTPTVAVITCGGTLANDQIGQQIFDVSLATGLTIVTSGATDLTISYR